MMKSLSVYAAMVASIVSCSPESAGPNILSPTATFIPEMRGGALDEGVVPGTPADPKNLTATGESGSIVLSFDIPKSYVGSGLSVGYRIFRRQVLSAAELEWDFSSPYSADWYLEYARVPASSCSVLGECQFIDQLGAQTTMEYAVLGYWILDDDDSAKSNHASVTGESLFPDTNLDFTLGFTDRPAIQILGTYLNEEDKVPDIATYSLRPKTIPWYQLGPMDMYSSYPQFKQYAKTLSIGASNDGLDMILPDPEFHRSIFLTRGDPDTDCSIFPFEDRKLCEAIIFSRPTLPYVVLGQKTALRNETFEESNLPASRKFVSSAAHIQKGQSGDVYSFISDENRILIRKGELQGCDFDVGESGETPEDRCGFQWSIGTYSPRQRCLMGQSGDVLVADEQCSSSDLAFNLQDSVAPSKHSLRMPGAPKIVGPHLYIPDTGNARVVRMPNFEQQLESCGRLLKPEEETYSRSLISLGAGFVLGSLDRGLDQNNIKLTLIDSDQANRGVEVISEGMTSESPLHFKIYLGDIVTQDQLAAALTSQSDFPDITVGGKDMLLSHLEVTSSVLGGVLSVGTYTATGGKDPKNQLCYFDRVIGQYAAAPEDESRFIKRDCLRGGERGGFEGLVELDPLAQFSDPLASGGAGGAACRLDTIEVDGQTRPYRYPADIKDRIASDISPDTGILSPRTRYMFRAPVQLETGPGGELYVLDSGYTRASSSSSLFEATLPPRIMVWRSDPFKYQRCYPVDPNAETPSCSEPSPGKCEGLGCAEAQCFETECAAQVFLGQPNDLSGFLHSSNQVIGDNLTPDGYYPISAFGVGQVAAMDGVWAVTGQDARILHFNSVDQTSLPVIHNNPLDRDPEDFGDYRDGVFSGIVVDSAGQKIVVGDVFTSRIVIWRGTPEDLLD